MLPNHCGMGTTLVWNAIRKLTGAPKYPAQVTPAEPATTQSRSQISFNQRSVQCLAPLFHAMKTSSLGFTDSVCSSCASR